MKKAKSEYVYYKKVKRSFFQLNLFQCPERILKRFNKKRSVKVGEFLTYSGKGSWRSIKKSFKKHMQITFYDKIKFAKFNEFVVQCSASGHIPYAPKFNMVRVGKHYHLFKVQENNKTLFYFNRKNMK